MAHALSRMNAGLGEAASSTAGGFSETALRSTPAIETTRSVPLRDEALRRPKSSFKSSGHGAGEVISTSARMNCQSGIS